MDVDNDIQNRLPYKTSKKCAYLQNPAALCPAS